MEATKCFTSFLKLFIWITIFLIFSCSPSRKHKLEISANILCGEWSLEGGEKRVNYPEIEFCKDRLLYFIHKQILYIDLHFTQEMTRCFLLMFMERDM